MSLSSSLYKLGALGPKETLETLEGEETMGARTRGDERLGDERLGNGSLGGVLGEMLYNLEALRPGATFLISSMESETVPTMPRFSRTWSWLLSGRGLLVLKGFAFVA